MKDKYCINCGLNHHTYKECKKPIISIGIILYYIQNNQIKFLMIRRKHTIGYIEFIRGNYNINNIGYLKKLLSVMSLEEKNNILNYNYTYLWKNLWQISIITKNDKYINSENKFNKLKNGFFIDNNFINIKLLFYNIYNWKETDWEFPKGKRKYKELDIDTAKREFYEETGISDQNYNIIYNFKIIENYKGINNNNYRNIYFIAKALNNNIPNINYSKKNQYCEISKIEWFNKNNTIYKIRHYYKEKINIVNKVFNYILKIENINYNSNE